MGENFTSKSNVFSEEIPESILPSDFNYPEYQLNDNNNNKDNKQIYKPPSISNTENHPQIISNSVILNQQSSIQLENLNLSIFMTNSVFFQCQSCKNLGMTAIKQNVNCLSFSYFLFSYFVLGPVPWLIYQRLRWKDFYCSDTQHSCSVCGAVIANYSAC